MKLSKLCKRLSVTTAMALSLVVLIAPAAQAKMKQQNIVQLVASSQSIVAGTVSKVTDGIDANGMPYTEVTLKVGDSAKGKIKTGEYTFRQFGLLKPRTLPNGHRLLTVAPPGFPQWHKDEYVVAFLYHPAAKTGLQTTVGLAQGKLTKIGDKLVNRFGNEGLFDNVEASANVLSASEQKLLRSSGPVDAKALMSLVGHMVEHNWIQSGLIKSGEVK